MADAPIHWQVDEAPARRAPAEPPGPGPAGPPAGRARLAFGLLAAGVVLVLGGGMWRANREAHREFEALVTELAGVVAAEARAQVSGDRGAAEAWLDPAAPRDWTQRYRRLYAPPPINPYNELCGVYGAAWHATEAPPALTIETARREGAGWRVVLALSWDLGSRPAERRAYRRQGRAWRRTPLVGAELGRGAARERRLGQVLLRGPAADVATLTEDPALAVDYPALDRRLQADLSPLFGPPDLHGPITVVVQPTELEGVVIEVGVAPERLVILNSPAVALVNPDGPLTAATLYRMELVQALLNARYAQFGFSELPFGPYWSLTGDERRAVRNRLREALAGAWRSQLARDPAPEEAYGVRYRNYGEWQRRCISDLLLVEQLLVTGRVPSVGELIKHASGDAGLSGPALLRLAGQPDGAAFERWARAWATTEER
jgi:hypothetical protein